MKTGLRVRIPFPATALAIALVPFTSLSAPAGWLTIKNDTQRTIVIQETTSVKGQPRRGKPSALLPGESIREFLPGPTVKTIEVLDARNLLVPLWAGNIRCQEETQAFLVKAVGEKVSVIGVARPGRP